MKCLPFKSVSNFDQYSKNKMFYLGNFAIMNGVRISDDFKPINVFKKFKKKFILGRFSMEVVGHSPFIQYNLFRVISKNRSKIGLNLNS